MFQAKPTATITARYTDENKTVSVDGVNANEVNEDNAAAQINKLLNVVGRSVAADENMVMTIKKEVVDND